MDCLLQIFTFVGTFVGREESVQDLRRSSRRPGAARNVQPGVRDRYAFHALG